MEDWAIDVRGRRDSGWSVAAPHTPRTQRTPAATKDPEGRSAEERQVALQTRSSSQVGVHQGHARPLPSRRFHVAGRPRRPLTILTQRLSGHSATGATPGPGDRDWRQGPGVSRSVQ